MSAHFGDGDVLANIVTLDSLSRAELTQLWEEQLGGPAPSVQRNLLMRVLAAKLQAKEQGDVSAAARAQLASAAKRARALLGTASIILHFPPRPKRLPALTGTG